MGQVSATPEVPEAIVVSATESLSPEEPEPVIALDVPPILDKPLDTTAATPTTPATAAAENPESKDRYYYYSEEEV